MKEQVIGTGYVGTMTGVCLGYLGHNVSCVDLDESEIHGLQHGDIPIYEPFLAAMLPLAAQRGTLEFTTGLARIGRSLQRQNGVLEHPEPVTTT